MYVDEFRNFINDYDTGKLYIFFDYPTTYFSQEGARVALSRCGSEPFGVRYRI